jgi:hypothetical protein
MLLGLILRGVAFEFRYKTQRLRWVCDMSFADEEAPLVDRCDPIVTQIREHIITD